MKPFFLATCLFLTASVSLSKVFDITEIRNQSQSSVQFNFQTIRTQPGDEVRFDVPVHLRHQKLSFVILGHRQDPATHLGGTPGQKQDSIPGLSAVLVHSTNLTGPQAEDAWRFWAGMSSGNLGAKFAEPRNDLEMENLYEWNTLGSRGEKSNQISYEGLFIDQVVVRNVGQDEVLVGQLTLKFIPSDIDHTQEAIFSPGTSFSKEFGGKAHLGGGQSFQGTFPGALSLLNSTHEIPLEEDVSLRGIEVALGDSHPDKLTNSDGGWGTQGWGRFSIGLGTSPSDIQWLTQNENVPPEGLALAFPLTETKTTKGLKIFLRGQSDTVYIMGVRISYKK